ncbi:MAG: hypothetical protein U0795_22765 [Pirellulales bacterium]
MIAPSTKYRENVRQGWCLSRPVLRFGEQLMSQQEWCWGRDVKYPGGNLLMEYGFERHRDTSGKARSTCYRMQHDAGQIALWGFGMFFGHRKNGGVFLRRYDFRPLWGPIESLSLGIHWPQELPVFRRPSDRKQWCCAQAAWASALRWIAQYETWVHRVCGSDYRRECVAEWLRPFVTADKMAAAWKYLGRREWERTSTEFSEAVAPLRIQLANNRHIDPS